MKNNVQKRLKESLSKKHICYVLITCDAPSDDGEMQVEMCYEGDAALAAYLLQGATQSLIDQQDSKIEELCCPDKILYLD